MSAGDDQPPWSSPTGISTPPPGRRRRRHPAARSRVVAAVVSGAAFLAGTVGLWVTQTAADADPTVTTSTTPATIPAPATTPAPTTTPTTTAAQLAPPSRRPADTSSHGS
jgi:hypothetical protein